MEQSSILNSNDKSMKSVFKVPNLSNRINKDFKKLSELKNPEGTAYQTKEKEELLSRDNRPAISFRPKSFTLPSEIYKPHRPTTSEFLERHIKKKQAKQQFAVAEKPLISEKTNTFNDGDSEFVLEKNDKQHSNILEEKSKKCSAKSFKATESKLKYVIPKWSCKLKNVLNSSKSAYYLEVLKNGSIIDKIEFSNCEKEFFSFGRLVECDFLLEHPSISR